MDNVKLRKIRYMKERYDLPYWIIVGFLEIHNYDIIAARDDIRSQGDFGYPMSKERRLKEEARLRKYISDHKSKN